ncbi:Zonula occludens toxin family protein [Sterolibacterium denitrificans]|uniref:Zonula occludens toxin family protein n=1 Tax=Sterolibacterium denitrificans TaxID=157592 RepID=A0A7Z7HS41_9PROT|nr:zonular occludens toxin domain-containing protein [Sterolibacterium denitrificans]SMB28111.1 Zonula occludens toxin family protein [Sterolibacterium denitrificans]
MLTIITGTPGAGKTAYAVSCLADLLEEESRQADLLEKEPRSVYVVGIPELVLPHEVAPEVSAWTVLSPIPEDASIFEAEFTFPDGSLIIIDEAQKIFRPRSASSKVPAHVSAFEKHRHKGLDFWLITQHPGLLDSNIRKLCDKHIHLRGHWAGRELLEWSGVADPESKSDRASAVRLLYTLPKKAFSLYKSASVHVKQSRRLPLAVYVFLGFVALALFLGWKTYNRVSSAISGETQEIESSSSSVSPTSFSSSRSASGQVSEISYQDFLPRFKGRPESAPIYDSVRKVINVPHVAGCAAMLDRCTCYTEQATDSGLNDAECRAWLTRPPFQPYRAIYPVDQRSPKADQGSV